MTPARDRGDGKGDYISDEQLLLRYTQGETEAFTELLGRYRRELYRFLCRFVGDAALAEDIFQETFLQVHLSAGGFDVSRRLRPWLFTIAANKARDALRSRFRRPAAELDARVSGSGENATRFVDLMPANIPPPMETLENQETASAVQNIVARMPEGLRTVLILSYFHEFPYKEIADILDVPLGTVKSRLHVAVKEFARRWKAAFGKPENEQQR
jgi:RNA polymerase sigma-70 factor (ECF subfamily)